MIEEDEVASRSGGQQFTVIFAVHFLMLSCAVLCVLIYTIYILVLLPKYYDGSH